jgi:hypothetical protein
VTESQQKSEPIGGIDFERARLRIAKPALGHEIVKEGMQALLANMRPGAPGECKGDGRALLFKIGRVIGENATAARLLPEFTGIDIAIIDLAPERGRHIKPVLRMA